MRQLPRFSIIIPVYEVAQYIAECISSVQRQKVDSVELICIDDGSKDRSGVILDEEARYGKPIRVIHQRNAGVSSARNRGLECIRGEYFFFLDGDDILLAGAIEVIDDLIQRHPSDCYVFPCFLQREVFDWEARAEGHGAEDILHTNEEKLKLICENKEVQGHVCGRIYRSQNFRSLRFPVGISLMEDQWFWMNALVCAGTVVISPVCYYGYRSRNTSVTRKQSSNQWISAIDVWLETIRVIQVLGGTKRDFHRFWQVKAGCIKSSIGLLIHQWETISTEQRKYIILSISQSRALTGSALLPLLLCVRLWLITQKVHKNEFSKKHCLYPVYLILLRMLDKVEYMWYGY